MNEANPFLISADFPYCKGCGHHLIARNTAAALAALGLRPLDVVLVTDIGCHGIVDNNFAAHTVHGLHGRSVALGAGIAMELPPGKKVVVFIGDGGATIGLQHLLEAARLNIEMTVVVHNNMLYGMTGGQPSGLTPAGFRTVVTPEGHSLPHHNLCQLAHDTGAPYARRIIGQGDFSDVLQEALAVKGFALVEVLELCPGHAVKMNPGLRLRELARRSDYEAREWTGAERAAFRLGRRQDLPSLLTELKRLEVRGESSLKERITILVSGSAGEGVQRAAGLFAQAAITAGLHATKRGSYPVTVGVGFSNAELVLSRAPIAYHGVSRPDLAILTSADGLRQNAGRIRQMETGIVWIDASLPAPETGAEVRVRDFRGRAGERNAALYGLLTCARETGVIPPEALIRQIRESPGGERMPAKVLEEEIWT